MVGAKASKAAERIGFTVFAGRGSRSNSNSGPPGPNQIPGRYSCRADNPLLVNVGAITTVEVGHHELVRIIGIGGNLGVLPSNQIVSFWIVLNSRSRVPTKNDFTKMNERELFDLICFRTSHVANND